MTLQPREQKLLRILAAVAVAFVIYYFAWIKRSDSVASASSDSVPSAEQRLARLRDVAATEPGKQEILKKVSADLAVREKGLITADTAQQAQARLITILREIGAAERPPVEIRATELGPIAAFGDKYGTATVSVQIECGIEQLLTLLASLPAQPEMLATRDLRITSANAKQKTLGVRLTVAGVIPKNLVPEKKGKAAF